MSRTTLAYAALALLLGATAIAAPACSGDTCPKPAVEPRVPDRLRGDRRPVASDRGPWTSNGRPARITVDRTTNTVVVEYQQDDSKHVREVWHIDAR